MARLRFFHQVRFSGNFSYSEVVVYLVQVPDDLGWVGAGLFNLMNMQAATRFNADIIKVACGGTSDVSFAIVKYEYLHGTP